MNSASWSSYQSAAELPDRDDDGPSSPAFWAAEESEAPGVFAVWFRSGAKLSFGLTRRVRVGLSQCLATSIAADLDSRYQERLSQRLKALVEAEDAMAADAEARLAADRAAMDAYDAAIVGEMMREPRCDWCGALVPVGATVCGPCLATYPPDEDESALSDAIPW